MEPRDRIIATVSVQSSLFTSQFIVDYYHGFKFSFLLEYIGLLLSDIMAAKDPEETAPKLDIADKSEREAEVSTKFF